MKKEFFYQYIGLHSWLRKTYGRADHCENPECIHKSTHFEYALKKGYEYSYDRNNFIQLCKSCHMLYDGNGMTGRRHSLKSRKLISENQKGKQTKVIY